MILFIHQLMMMVYLESFIKNLFDDVSNSISHHRIFFDGVCRLITSVLFRGSTHSVDIFYFHLYAWNFLSAYYLILCIGIYMIFLGAE